MAVYGLMVAVLLMCLTGYHTAAIGSNETTQEDVRDKYETWGGNPYNMGKWSKQNLYYAFRQHESLIYGKSIKNDQLKSLSFNQHLFDSELIFQMEIDEDESHVDHDMKSVKSLKSFKSIRSEVLIESSKNSVQADPSRLDVQVSKHMTQPLSQKAGKQRKIRSGRGRMNQSNKDVISKL